MILFCVVIKRDSVSFFIFLFLNPIQDLLGAISSVCLLKYPHSCFSSHFCFQVFADFFLVLFFVIAVTDCSNLLFCTWLEILNY